MGERNEGGIELRAMLQEVNLDTGELITLDGEKYLVNPGDLTTCCTWTPTAELEINIGKGYIKNLECDVTIELI
jgi:hypothetical protein